mgnify:CR=1 FL=1
MIIEDVKMLLESIKKRANEHKYTLMVGRSHGIHGEPITFGLTDSLFKDSFRVRLGDFDNYLISLKFFILSSLPDPDIYKILGEIFFLDPITFFRIL